MKRFNLWVREFSLAQQLMCIVFIVVLAIAIIYVFPVTNEVNSFVASQFYDTLNGVNNAIMQEDIYDDNTKLVIDSKLTVAAYDLSDKQTYLFQGSLSEVDLDGAKVAIDKLLQYNNNENISDGFLVNDKVKYNDTNIYFAGQCDDNRCIVTMCSSTYQDAFKTSLINSIITTIFAMTSLILIVLFFWIGNIIRPLGQMRRLVNSIKNGEKVNVNYIKTNRSDEIGDLANAIVSMKEYIDHQDQVKQEMIQNISHDLKTPIATIKSYAESIIDGIYPYGTLEDSVNVILEHATRLEKKVHSLLLLNKVEYIKDSATPGETLALNEIIDKVISQFKTMYKDIDWQVDVDDSKFHGNEDSWRIVIENLVENATRFAQTYIKVELHKGLLCISNDGSKIDDATLQTIFKPYEVGNNGRFGLGLSIVKKICDTYGYNVVAQNLSNGVIFKISKVDTKKSWIKNNKNDGKA